MFIYNKDLKPLLKEKGIKQAELAEKLNISTRAIKGWVAGTNSPTYDRHLEIMKLLDITDISFDADAEMSSIVNIPLLSDVQAGEFTDTQTTDSSIEQLKIPKELFVKDCFALRVKGNSMIYDYSESQKLDSKYSKYSLYENDNLIINPNKKIANDLINKVVVAANTDGATVKLIYKIDEKLYLMPLNSKYQNNSDILSPDEAEIVGQVINSYTVKNFS